MVQDRNWYHLYTGSRIIINMIQSKQRPGTLWCMEVTAMRKIKEIIFSENGMKAVNTLFFLSMLFYRSGLLFVTYIVWICYLVYCIKNTESRGNKVIYSLFAGLAVVMIGVNLYGYSYYLNEHIYIWYHFFGKMYYD